MSNKTLEPDARLDDPENPEWTEADFARARPASAVHGSQIAATMVRKRGRPPKAEEDRKQQVTLRLSKDVLQAARDSGPGWQARVDSVLRAALTTKPTTMAEFGAEVAKAASSGKTSTRASSTGRILKASSSRRQPRDGKKRA
jgi:uncharacterized protein (DUF4415 family)